MANMTSFQGYVVTDAAGVLALVTGIKTAGSGSAYTATVEGISTVTTGVSFVMIPHTVSTTTTPTLNVNGSGAKQIKRPSNGSTGGSLIAGNKAGWLAANKPVIVSYNGTNWIIQLPKSSLDDLTSPLPINKGGTGKTTANEALNNLGMADYVIYEKTDETQTVIEDTPIWKKTRLWKSGILEFWEAVNINLDSIASSPSTGVGSTYVWTTLNGDWNGSFYLPTSDITGLSLGTFTLYSIQLSGDRAALTAVSTKSTTTSGQIVNVGPAVARVDNSRGYLGACCYITGKVASIS